MKVCPKCGYIDRSQYRGSRFEYDAEYMRFEEAKQEQPEIYYMLLEKPNFEPYYVGELVYYRRGTGGLWLYRCLKENFKVNPGKKKP